VRTSSWIALGIATLLALSGGDRARAQRSTAPPRTLPPLSQTCPMHPDVIERRPGTCPICKMSLVPVRLDTTYICPVHTTVTSDGPGTCRLCGRPLVEARVALTWTCTAQPAIDRIEPGTCPDGAPMVPRRTLRPHGNHNPQHGGQFFMAADNWHHLEGVWPEQGAFRVYFYDDYSKPLAIDRLRQVAGRIVTKEAPADGAGEAKELEAFPLELSPDGQPFLIARIGTLPMPAEITAKIKLRAEVDEQRFDFVFQGLSTESESAPVMGGVVALEPTMIPDTVAGIIGSLQDQDRELKQLVDSGQFGLLYVTAFRARDLALALEAHAAALPGDRRTRAEAAATRMVQAAWLLDAAGDLGNRAQVVAAYARFTAGLVDAAALFGSAP
jgi:hypothetical protein